MHTQDKGFVKSHRTVLSLKTDLLAVRFVDCTTGHTFGAAVTAIVRTPFIVVVVVAVAVSLVTWSSTGFLRLRRRWFRCVLVVWVDALALQTELRLHKLLKNVCMQVYSQYGITNEHTLRLYHSEPTKRTN